MDNVSNYYSEGLGMYGVWVVYEGLWAVLKRFYVIHRLSGMQVSCYLFCFAFLRQPLRILYGVPVEH